MHPIISHNLSQIHALCKEHKVKKLWIFGSVTRGDFNENSDVDFLYEMDDENISEDEFYQAFWGFFDKLRELLNRNIDMAWYSGIKNPFFKEEIDETKVLIYDQEREKISL